jgi:PEP-CTERM motif
MFARRFKRLGGKQGDCMGVLSRHAILAGMMLGMAGSASAATQIFSGVDNGAVPGGSTPNSSAAQAAFLAAAAAKGPVFTNYLDDEPIGNQQSYHIAGGMEVYVAGFNPDPPFPGIPEQGIRNTSFNGNPSLPFSTTEGPDDQGKWMGIPIQASMFIFDVPTYSFGFYVTGLDSYQSEVFNLYFDQDQFSFTNPYAMPVNVGGGIMYYGIVFDTPVHNVQVKRGIINAGIDYFGIDGISFNVAPAPPPPVGGVPEPASWALLIAGFGLTGAAVRRRRAAPDATAIQHAVR